LRPETDQHCARWPGGVFRREGSHQRAGDLDGLKDGIGQAISTIKAADVGIGKIERWSSRPAA
jgi:hypothetical protein